MLQDIKNGKCLEVIVRHDNMEGICVTLLLAAGILNGVVNF
jgi:hypothetical protein